MDFYSILENHFLELIISQSVTQDFIISIFHLDLFFFFHFNIWQPS